MDRVDAELHPQGPTLALGLRQPRRQLLIGIGRGGLRPGDRVRFQLVTLEAAHAALRARERTLRGVEGALRWSLQWSPQWYKEE